MHSSALSPLSTATYIPQQKATVPQPTDNNFVGGRRAIPSLQLELLRVRYVTLPAANAISLRNCASFRKSRQHLRYLPETDYFCDSCRSIAVYTNVTFGRKEEKKTATTFSTMPAFLSSSSSNKHPRYSSYSTHHEFSSQPPPSPSLIASSLSSSPLQPPSRARRQEPLLLEHNSCNLFLQAQITEGSGESPSKANNHKLAISSAQRGWKKLSARVQLCEDGAWGLPGA